MESSHYLGTLPARGKREQAEPGPGSLPCPEVTHITSSSISLARANQVPQPWPNSWGGDVQPSHGEEHYSEEP